MAKALRTPADPTSVIGYLRVSTSEQADSGLSLNAQRTAIVNHCAQKGWVLVEMVEDAGYSAKNLSRPGMARALDLLATGAAGALVVAKLDRATRSVIDAANLLAQGQREGWALVALDLGLDPTSPAGELVATIMAAVAQWERRAIGARTSDALAAKKAAGVILGRPAVLPEFVTARIMDSHAHGASLSGIARDLNEAQVPTAHGGQRWYASTVRAVIQRIATPEKA